MTLAEAQAEFIDHLRQEPGGGPDSHIESFELLNSYFGRSDTPLESITPERMRDLLARWFIEQTGPQGPHIFPTLADTLSRFLLWVEPRAQVSFATVLSLLAELEGSIPRAMELTEALSKRLAERGGAFDFPEFLSSFEEGGHSSYDLDAPGSVGALESYFRILRIETAGVEAEDLITQQRVWPLLFPKEIASLLTPDYIINLEIVRGRGGWHIAACGFAYPPGTEL